MIKKKQLSLYLILMITLTTVSCTKDTESDPQPLVKVGLVGGLGGYNDAGFNQNILQGFQRAAIDYQLSPKIYECTSAADFLTGISFFVQEDYDLIITSGYDAAEATLEAANANPSISFILIDYQMDNPPANLQCIVFDVDQSSFPCGFLAAWWADIQAPENPVAGFVGGPEIPEIRQFSISYLAGINYYNAFYTRQVNGIGCYAGTFTDTLVGARLADSLIQQGASVIFAFAGKTGNGVLHKVKESGKWAIGVDVDQYLSIPEVGPYLLTSCMKELDAIVYTAIGKYCTQSFTGGTVSHCNLS
ncbi:MAG: hypothetical protein CVU06_08590, partial [Bacteroidetes bacterium HGW-Bacteroidetes-22]